MEYVSSGARELSFDEYKDQLVTLIELTVSLRDKVNVPDPAMWQVTAFTRLNRAITEMDMSCFMC